MTAKERLNLLLDEGTLAETGAGALSRAAALSAEKVPGDGVLTGYGTVEGRPVYVAAQDSGFMGGALGEIHAAKIADAVNKAVKVGVPFVLLVDCSGARMEEGLEALEGMGSLAGAMASASGIIPMVAAVMGNAPAGMSMITELADFVFITKDSHMSVNSPDAVKAAGTVDATPDSVAGAEMNSEKNGCAHFACENDESCVKAIKELLAVLPDNNLDGAPVEICGDDLSRYEAGLDSITLNGGYDVRDIIKAVSDNNFFLEVHENYGKSAVVGFAKFNGSTVGVAANQNAFKDGALNVKACIKMARFVQFCDAFNIPLVTFTDTAGFVPCIRQEKQGLARSLAKLVYTFSQADVPSINVIINKAYGSAYIAMNSKGLGADITYAWNTSDIAPLDPVTAASVLYHDEIAASDNQAAARAAKAEEYKKAYATPLNALAKGYVDEVIAPGETRARIISGLELLSTKKTIELYKKHGTK